MKNFLKKNCPTAWACLPIAATAFLTADMAVVPPAGARANAIFLVCVSYVVFGIFASAIDQMFGGED